MIRTNSEVIATRILSHCCARNADGSMSTIGEMKIARMNRITQATSAITKILFMVPEYSTCGVQPVSAVSRSAGLIIFGATFLRSGRETIDPNCAATK